MHLITLEVWGRRKLSPIIRLKERNRQFDDANAEFDAANAEIARRASLPAPPSTPVGLAIDAGTHNRRLMHWGVWIAENDPTMTMHNYTGVIAGFEAEANHILAVNAAAAGELNQVDLVFGGFIALPLAALSAPAIAVGGFTAAGGYIGLASGANHATGIAAPLTGSDQLLLGNRASNWLDGAAVVTGVASGIKALATNGIRLSGRAAETNLGSLTTGEATRIQAFADRYGTTVNVVGSRANGTAGPLSDFDYILGDAGANSRLRAQARLALPRGSAGGEIHPTWGETGIDVFKAPLDRTRPYIPFNPKVPK